LFGIDSGRDTLIRIGGVDGTPSPNGGQLFTIGALGVNATGFGGFDIQGGSNTAYSVLRVGGIATLVTVNLTTGAVMQVGSGQRRSGRDRWCRRSPMYSGLYSDAERPSGPES